MKDTEVKDKACDDKVVVSKDLKDMTVETKCEMTEKECVEDSGDKVLNNLADAVEGLNIKVSEEEAEEEKKECNREAGIGEERVDSGEYTERGPHGGKPAEYIKAAPVSMFQKTIPMPVLMADGNYMQCSGQAQQVVSMNNGNRRGFDESDEYGQPMKFTRPNKPYFEPQLPQNFNFGEMPNNLSGFGNNFQQPQPDPIPFDQSRVGLYPYSSAVETTTMNITNSAGGGKVTVQTPLSPSFVDDFLNDCAPSSQQFTEYRRPSQDTDSGLESEGVGSPWSDQAPSPGSAIYNPPSVDSGCGRSPLHESQALPGMSPPKYPGTPSPASHRATPSPAATSGYGSPGAPEFDEEELDLVLDVMKNVANDCEVQKQQKRFQVQSQMSAMGMPQQPSMNQGLMPMVSTIQQMPVQQPGSAGQIAAPPMIAPPTFKPNNTLPTATTQQPIIILQQQPQQTMPVPQSVLIMTVNGQAPIQQPKRPGPRKILPKIAQQPNKGTQGGQSGMPTSANQSSKPGGTVASTPGGKPNLNADRAHSKLLVIAHRTVANIPRDQLKQSDDEGDTILHIAVCKTDRYMVQALLERLKREGLECLVDQENNKRQTPLYLAVAINQPVMVNMFIKFQANVNVLAQNVSTDKMTIEVKAAIHVASSQGRDHLRTLQELLKAKDISINIVNNYGQTALHCAILAHGRAKRDSSERINSIEIIQTLIKAGADPSAQDKKSGKTPLMYGIEQKNHELVETILRTVDPDKVKNVVKTQAFDGSSCLRIAEGLKGSFEVEIWNRLWNSLQSAANGTLSRYQYQPAVSY